MPPKKSAKKKGTKFDQWALKDGQYLNDNLVDFYLKYMHCNKMTVDKLGGDGARDLDPQKFSEVKISSSLY